MTLWGDMHLDEDVALGEELEGLERIYKYSYLSIYIYIYAYRKY